jgi:hypothetical protein
MNPLHEAAAEIQASFAERSWSFCFIGGLAVQRWGEPRTTQDVDATLLTGFGNEEIFVDALLSVFRGRLADSRDFALRRRVLLLFASNGVAVDVALGAMPFEEAAVSRATPHRVANGVELLTCSAEDLVVFKAFAGRDRDWADIGGILDRQAGRLDEALIFRELRPLLELKEDSSTEARLRSLFEDAR